ncbi:IucA/IucC family siderophore biosynthesis protein [Sporosarcina sp. JAI121]|uniref:IucA/IucC family protein n=1 Tax=Sporosarcina sp. JAI121 TaxID=2723064 RepID=UPI0015C7CC6D|nr:IucA/IucC family protein [Sporosarcina sp. JAI121]NYF26098.1 siderophore synthetase component [Sporosarcina sp. JAI121]
MADNKQVNSAEQANFHTCKTLLNCYIREFCSGKLNVFPATPKKKAYSIYFPTSDIIISGILAFYSEMGEHEYENFYVKEDRQLDYSFLVQLIIEELKHANQLITDEGSDSFSSKVENSYHKLALFLNRPANQSDWNYLSSEQSVLYGHPFHPFPKNTQGFTEDEVEKFCPELRTSFPLCYLAVRKDIFHEEWVSEERRIELHESVKKHVQHVLKDKKDAYAILPIHPWQYEHVKMIKEVRDYIDQEKIIPLGSFGPMAYPTSSVRTVFIPEMNCNVKLSLNIQITNMMRNNNKEQMRRTLDATTYLLHRDCFQQEVHTYISYEVGVCTCRFENEDLTKLFTIVYRPLEFDEASTYVLSSLIEAPVEGVQSRLCSMIGNQNVEQWFVRYLEISLLPIVRLAEEKGIHFEAHLQNSLVTIKNGLPDVFIIRDLEGVSVNIEKVTDDVDMTGPLFYQKEETWARTSYYFVVNHLGSLIHALAKDVNVAEKKFWAIVRQVLMQEYERNENQFVHHLLTTRTFTAKKNMMSCLLGKSETPSYIPVKNVMNTVGSETYGNAKLLV